MYVNSLFCVNEKRKKKNSDYFIHMPNEQLIPFPSAGRKRSVSLQRRDSAIVRFPAIKGGDTSSRHINLNSSVIIHQAGILPIINRRKNSILTIIHKQPKLDQSSQANF